MMYGSVASVMLVYKLHHTNTPGECSTGYDVLVLEPGFKCDELKIENTENIFFKIYNESSIVVCSDGFERKIV